MTLQITNLAYARDDVPLFTQLSVSIDRGDCLQIIGANGSGKSTLLRLLAGFIPTEPGVIVWDTTCSINQRAAYQQQLHYIGHHSGTRAHLTVKENLLLNVALANEKHTALAEACTTTGIHAQFNTLAADLSAGQRQRLALTRLLLVKKPLWLLDEPMTALDKSGRDLLQQLLTTHLAQGGSAVVATHHELMGGVKTLALGGNHV